MPDEILDCPFCGNAATVKHVEVDANDIKIACSEPDECYAAPSVYGNGFKEALERWNGRAIPY